MICSRLHSSQWLSPPILTAPCSVLVVCLTGLDCCLPFPRLSGTVSLPLHEAFRLPLFHASGIYPMWFETKQAKNQCSTSRSAPCHVERKKKKKKNRDFRLILSVVPLEEL